MVAISETRLSNRITLKLPGFSCYRHDKHHSGKGQGVAILVKSDLKHSLLCTPETKNLEAIGVKLEINQRSFILFSVYQSPNLLLDTSDLDLLLKLENQVLLMGDLNAKHDYWFPGMKNPNGNLLFKHFSQGDYQIHAPDSPTLVHYRLELRKSLPDLILSRNINNIVDVETIPALSSNHLPVMFRIKIKFQRTVLKRFNYAKADWKRYRSTLNSNISLSSQVFKTEEEIDFVVSNLTQNIIAARDDAVPLTRVSAGPHPLPRKIKRLIKYKNRLRRVDQKETDPEVRKNVRAQITFLSKSINTGIKCHNDAVWNDKLQKVNCPSSDLWRLAKSMKSSSSSSAVPPLKREDASTTSTPRDQCEELATAFHMNMTLTSDWCQEENEVLVGNSMTLLQNFKPNTFIDSPIHPKEIWKHIHQLKLRKAPGPDNVGNCQIKNLPQKAIVLLTKIFNACLALAYFPTEWKMAKVIAIKKPGKDEAIPSSYRPISLLPSIAKLFEKLVNSRLIKCSYNKLIDEQFGFRNAHSTVQQLARVAETVANNQNLGDSSGMFLLDLEKAFDTVWHHGLLHKLIVNEVPLQLVKMIGSYLSNRSFKVTIGSDSSSPRPIPAGVPQGSILGPYLFLIFLNDIPKQTRTSLACFADDTACFTSSNDVDLIIDRLQLSLDKLSEFFAKWKLKLNSTKTEAILFTRSRFSPTRNLLIDGYPIPWSNTVKYLGLVLDQKLNWNAQVANLRLKGTKAYSALYPLMNRNSLLSSHTKMAIYSTLIRPCITYGCPVWGNTSKTNHDKLQVLQNKALKLSYNTPFQTNLFKLHKIINLPTLLEYIIKLTKKFYCLTNPNHTNKLISAIGHTRPLDHRYRYVTKLPHHYALSTD